eukprot:CAMPEP_0119545470 /NCGR_PEP_ID=MMETSP1352-20130426/217_1 /TAXON_ID=265584 /ORGANISM="Stauroneis constricta, Strain CCMP1120" /LENGTH=230 /DNA_ID=CAMNT_0007590019 /DNA_START=177 /DNA_END=869 /DNA_ORIENTATION=-
MTTSIRGGFCAWRRQRLDQHRGLPTDYADIRQATELPRGWFWVNNRTSSNDWYAVREADDASVSVVVNPRGHDGSSTSNTVATATTGSIPCASAVIVREVSEDSSVEPRTTTTSNSNSKSSNDLECYTEHHITKDDTFMGICLRYHVSAMELRRANGLLSNCKTLSLAPNPLKIPLKQGEHPAVEGEEEPVRSNGDDMVYGDIPEATAMPVLETQPTTRSNRSTVLIVRS